MQPLSSDKAEESEMLTKQGQPTRILALSKLSTGAMLAFVKSLTHVGTKTMKSYKEAC